MLTLKQIDDAVTVKLLADQTEDFLPAETDGVLYALLNSIRWSVLRFAAEQKNHNPSAPIQDLRTENVFSTKWVSREEIVNRIMDMSGFDKKIAELALTAIEDTVKMNLEKNGWIIEVEQIGIIKASNPPDLSYEISLADGMKLGPALRAIGQTATS